MDYQKREEKAVRAIKKAIPSSLKSGMLKQSKGMFAELYQSSVFPKHYCAVAIDGVGTKLILAQAMNKYDTIGIDLVAMSANDLATLGAVAPFMFLDYLAVQSKVEEKYAGHILKGMVKGLQQCDASKILRNSVRINLGKGETASVDELMGGIREGYGFDIAGAMIGFIEKRKLNTKVSVGDKIIALASSGPHSNAYTDLRLKLLKGEFEKRKEFRKNYKGRFRLNADYKGKTIGNWLLEPTKIYLKTMAAIASKYKVVGINNTGYGLKNLNRVHQKVAFHINNPMKPQPIFELVQKEAKYSDKEMYQRFNMGMGFFIIAKKKDAPNVLKLARKMGEKAQIVGDVRKSNVTQTILIKNKKKIACRGY